MNNLALTLQAQGDLPGRASCRKKTLDIRRRVLGPEHPDTLTSMNNLAVTLYAQGDLGGGAQAARRDASHPPPGAGAGAPGYIQVRLESVSDTSRLGRARGGTGRAERDLLWLLDRDPATLGADQRQIRENVAQVVKESG